MGVQRSKRMESIFAVRSATVTLERSTLGYSSRDPPHESASAIPRSRARMIFFYLYLGIVMPILSVIAFVMYWHDKQQAIHLAERVSESALLAIGQFGGWPGALLAQKILKHKTAKLSFQIKFMVTLVGHVVVVTIFGVWLYFITRG
jgi:uncharacterized membrane protein YsdA (DUF1294 family)